MAVLAVLVEHFFDDRYSFHRVFPWGNAGVRLFYVLSGFLITRILIKGRARAVDPSGHGRRAVLQAFYARRFLRIFPIYYATLAIVGVASVGIRAQLPWFVAYLQNVQIALQGRFGVMPHFWSLAVEEQFYIVWPFLVLCIPGRLLGGVLISMVMLGPLSRGLGLIFGLTPVGVSVLTTSCLDSLGAGAVLAFASTDQTRRRLVERVLPYLAVAGAAGVAVLLRGGKDTLQIHVLFDTAFALPCLWLVRQADNGALPATLFETRSMQYIGKISYGIYVFHYFAAIVVRQFMTRSKVAIPLPLEALVSTALAITVAALSWEFFESKINGAKRFFSYTGGPRPRAVLDGSRKTG
jgi:peptidoglycan/LPS O-acetylase OafA/YrhL